MSKSKFRSAYERSEHMRVPEADCGREARAKQSFRQECNINSIMRRYERTGVIEQPNADKGSYLDCPAEPSFQQSLNTVIAVQERFNALPAEVRKRFANDPVAFVNFVSDDANADEMEKLGLLSKEAVERREKARREAAVAAKEKEAEKAKAAVAAPEGE